MATQRLTNMYNAWNIQLVDILQKFGMKSVRELRRENGLADAYRLYSSQETESDHNG